MYSISLINLLEEVYGENETDNLISTKKLMGFYGFIEDLVVDQGIQISTDRAEKDVIKELEEIYGMTVLKDNDGFYLFVLN